jgi:hypothetical protein
MSYEIEKDWTTDAGLRAVVIMGHLGHRCGYVGIPTEHSLYGVGHGDKTPHLKLDSPEYVFEVHGGLTYSGNGREKYPVESELWWFGYDCGHAGDAPAPGPRMFAYYHEGDVHRTLEYCISECESLARQIMEKTS